MSDPLYFSSPGRRSWRVMGWVIDAAPGCEIAVSGPDCCAAMTAAEIRTVAAALLAGAELTEQTKAAS